MRKSMMLAVSLLVFGTGLHGAGQFPIKIPKIKVEKPRSGDSRVETEPPAANGTSQSTMPQTESVVDRGSTTNVRYNDVPTIAKDSIQIRAFTFSSYRNNNDVWSWVPEMKFGVNGPVASGSRLYVEFTIPGTGAWLKFDCTTEATQAGYSMKTTCGGRQISEEKGSIYTGAVNFTIRLANELAGSETTLFTGKMQVGKARSNETAPQAAKHFVYYVDHDWNLPIGYLFYEGDERFDANDPRRWEKPKFNIAFWTRGESNGFAVPHLFYGGKEVGKLYYNGGEVGTPNCSVTEAQNNATHITQPAGQFVWTRFKCTFSNVVPWNLSSVKNETMFGRIFLLSENPGAYEMKIMRNGRLIRTFSFAVDANGKLVDNGIARTNKLGSDRIIVPMQVIGDQDGTWNRNAWKTDAFYGNPLSGFAMP